MARSAGLYCLMSLAFALVASPVWAQSLDQHAAHCRNRPEVTVEARINGCTTLIQSGRLDRQNLAAAFANRGLGYSRQENYAQAIADFDQAIRLNPGLEEAWYGRGQAYTLGPADHRRAISDYGRVIELNPRHLHALLMRCWSYGALGERLDAALRDCDAALAISPQYSGALNARALVRFKLAQFAEALADYDASFRANPEFTGSLYGRGVARLRLGQTAEGQADIAAATARNADIAAEYARYGVTP